MTSKNSKSKGTSTYRAASARVGMMLRFTQAAPEYLEEPASQTTIIDGRGREVRGILKRKAERKEKYKTKSGYINILQVIGVVEEDARPSGPVCTIRVVGGTYEGSAIRGTYEDVVADIEQAREEARRELAERMFADIAPVIMRAQAMINGGNAHPFGVAEAPETNSQIVAPGRPRVSVHKRKRRQ